MATRKPLVIISGRIQEQPEGDSPAGAEPTVAAPGSTPAEKYWRGDKTWRDFFTDVRAATLTGLSTATNAVVAATDTVLAAIGKLQAQVSAKFDKTGGDIDGNVNITGAGRRITGDFSNATLVNRLMFQTSTSNAITSVSAIPNGTGVGGNFSAYAAQDPANSSRAQLAVVAGVSVNLASDKTGAGTYLPLFTYVNGVKQSEYPLAGGFLVTNGALGYGAGAGGTVTQTTSKSTPVTLNKPCGRITMHGAALAAGASVSFSLLNSIVAVGDLVLVQARGFAANLTYRSWTDVTANGAVVIALQNISAGSLSEAVVIDFVVIKGSTS